MIAQISLMTFVLLTFSTCLWASDTVDSAREDLAEVLLSKVGENVVDELEVQGLSRTDAEQVAEALAKDSADCFIDTIEKLAIENDIDADELVSAFIDTITSSAQSDLSGKIDPERLKYEAEACLLTALENAGIDAR